MKNNFSYLGLVNYLHNHGAFCYNPNAGVALRGYVIDSYDYEDFDYIDHRTLANYFSDNISDFAASNNACLSAFKLTNGKYRLCVPMVFQNLDTARMVAYQMLAPYVWDMVTGEVFDV